MGHAHGLQYTHFMCTWSKKVINMYIRHNIMTTSYPLWMPMVVLARMACRGFLRSGGLFPGVMWVAVVPDSRSFPCSLHIDWPNVAAIRAKVASSIL